MLAVAKIDAAARLFLLTYAAVLGFSRAGIHTAVIVLALIFLCRFLRQPFRIDLDKSLSLAMKVFFGSLILSTILSSDHLTSAKFLGTLAFRFLPLFIVLAFVNEEKFLQRAVVLMAGSLTVGSLAAIFQGLQGAGRAPSFLGIMDFGGILGLLIPLFVIQGIESREYKPWQKGLLFTAAFLGCIASIFNGTRSIWVSVGLCLLLTVFWLERKNVKVLAAGIVLVCTVAAIGFSSPRVVERVNTLFDRDFVSNVHRVMMWEHGWNTFLEHPVTGSGLATMPEHPFFLRPEARAKKQIYGHVHNNFLQMLAENGIIGFAAFSFLFGTIIYTGWMHRTGTSRVWGLSAAVCTCEFLTHGLFDYTLNIATVTYTYWFIIGLAYARYRLAESKK